MSERPPPLSAWRAFRLICRMEWWRVRGRYSEQGQARARAQSLLGGKGISLLNGSRIAIFFGSLIMAGVMLVLSLFATGSINVQALSLSVPSDLMFVDENHDGRPHSQDDKIHGGDSSKGYEGLPPSSREAVRKEVIRKAEEGYPFHGSNLLTPWQPLTPAQRQRLDAWVEKGGPAPFLKSSRFPIRDAAGGDPVAWPAKTQAAAIAASMSLLGVLCTVALVIFPWGSGLSRLGTVGWGLEWLMSLPAPAPAIFAARVLGGVLTDNALWLMVAPALIGAFVVLGHPVGIAILLAITTAGAWGLLAAVIRETGEFALRRVFAASRLRNLEALSAIVGYVLPIGMILVLKFDAVGRRVVSAGLLVGGHLAASPWYAMFLPPPVPGAWSGVALAWLWGLGAMAAGAALVAWWTRGGLLAGGGLHSAPPDSVSLGARRRFPPLVRKEWLLLKRDRAYLSRTLIVPLLLVAMQFVMRVNESVVDGAIPWIGAHAALIAYVVGAYIVAMAGYELLAREGPQVWLLFTFPRSLTDQLKQKALAWIVISASFALASFVAIGFLVHFEWSNWGRLPFALAAVVVNGYVAGALGIIGVKELSAMEKPRLRLGYYWIYNILTGGMAAAIYGGDTWGEISQVCIVGFTAYALWEKAADREVTLLDPTAPLPRKLYLAEVLIALALFLAIASVILGLVAGLAHASPIDSALMYLLVGGLVTGGIYQFFSDRADLLASASARLGPRASLERTAIITFGAAALAVFIGLGYQLLVQHLLPAGTDGHTFGSEARLGMFLAAVFGAPVFEEYLFRGLLYPLLRERWSVTPAALVSAIFFASLHSGYAAIPVFCVGVILAHVREHTNRLPACMIVHAAYNAVMVLTA